MNLKCEEARFAVSSHLWPRTNLEKNIGPTNVEDVNPFDHRKRMLSLLRPRISTGVLLMSKLFSLTVALIATVLIVQSNAQAQMYPQGFQLGAGMQAGGFGNCGNFGRFFHSIPREQPPYFAQFPPVYYSHIVPRPYGFSPYAVPGGILPAEMTVPVYLPNPTIIKNPHFHGEVIEEPLPVVIPSDEAEEKKAEPTSARKTSGWIKNPHFAPRQGMVASN
jgi:hypothetical protein